MNTITQTKNRLNSESFISDTAIQHSLLPPLLHIMLHNQVSSKDCQILNSLAPHNCSLFIIHKNNMVFVSEIIRNNINKIMDEISFSFEASFVQHVQNIHHGTMRILTIPLDKKTFIGLVSPVGLDSIASIEDSFLHKIETIKKEFENCIQIVSDINRITIQSDPTLIICRNDDQIIGWNNSALTFFNLYPQDILNADITIIQKNCPKSTKRKLQITNRTFQNNDFSIVQYSNITSENANSETITEELKIHTEHLLNLYRELQTETKHSALENIESKIIDLERCFQNITTLQNNEKITI